MEEKVLVKSERYNIKKLLRTMLLIASGLTLIGLIWILADAVRRSIVYYDATISSAIENALTNRWSMFWLSLDEVLLVYACMVAASVLVFCLLKSYEMIITDKRIYGKVAFGKRVDLPIDSLSAVAIIPLFRGVAVSTSSGRIGFLLIKNANEMYDVLNHLLIERQDKEEAAAIKAPPVSAQSSADELKKYKELLDSGVISQEEFDAKKKQLLGL